MSLKRTKLTLMKKSLLILLLILGAAIPSTAQPPTYDDLLIYYADGDYEKLLKKAEQYTLNDKTKQDALPFLYLSKANFDMSKDQVWLDKYPKAFADAITFAGSCIKKDKDGSVQADNIKYFTDLKIALVEDVKNLVSTKAYPKVISAISKLHKVAKDDVGSYFLKAACQYNTGDKSAGKATAIDAYARLDKVTTVEGWRPVDMDMLRIGVIEFCKSQILLNQRQKALDLLGRVKQWFEKDKEFMDYYCETVGC